MVRQRIYQEEAVPAGCVFQPARLPQQGVGGRSVRQKHNRLAILRDSTSMYCHEHKQLATVTDVFAGQVDDELIFQLACGCRRMAAGIDDSIHQPLERNPAFAEST